MQTNKTRFIGIDLFAGAGGLSLGATMAGVEVLYAIENDTHAAETYRCNHKKTELFVEDIRSIDVHKISLPKTGNFTSILFGGPPCQGFSTSNQKTRNKQNPSNWLFKDFIRIMNLIMPDWVVFENVKGIFETEKGLFKTALLSDMVSSGYTCTWIVLNAADIGIPQVRSRFFLVGSKRQTTVSLEIIKKSNRYTTVADAISDLPSLRSGASIDCLPYSRNATNTYAKMMRGSLCKCTGHLVTNNSPLVLERYSYVPPGGNWQNIPDTLMDNYKDHTRCHTGIYHRLESDKPSVVLGNYRKNMLIHPIEDRGLSVREAARLQSFPDWYIFRGSIGFQQQQVSNAVPPLLAKEIFDKIVTLY